MKHMVVNTHHAESCAFRSEEDGALLGGALDAFVQACSDLDVTLDGTWVNRSAHTIFFLLDAPTAHAIDEAVLKGGLIGRTRTEIFPVFAMEEVRAAMDAASST